MNQPLTNAVPHAADDHNPSHRQAAAADPLKSVWVGASAGTGKTKVLVDRLLRLMLPRPGQAADSASRPEKILCLTFTKTGAAEMSNRIYDRLAGWAVMDETQLRQDLQRLTGVDDDIMLREARRLFARVLDAPGGLKIMTIHSFCQSVLKRFPIEAGVAPHFELMDEQSALEYLTRCLHRIIAEARHDPDSGKAKAFSELALHLDSAGMSDLMSKVMSKRSLLTEILSRHGDKGGDAAATIAAMRAHLDLQDHERDEADILALAANIHEQDEKNLLTALRALLQGSKTDQDRAQYLQPWLEQKARRAQLLNDYRRAFFTLDGDIAKRLATKAVQDIYPDIVDVMTREADRLLALQEKLAAVRLAKINAALLTVAAEVLGHYTHYKAETDRLDFDDLIIKTCDLLSGSGMVEWVLFKMDEGIDHILVDEAQDTSPQQWKVIRALADEFYTGYGSRDDKTRTLFVVGDEKQSIFSFQGADPAAFDRMQKHFGGKALQVQAEWEILLQYSFRSTHTVLDLVDRVFADPVTRRGVVADLTRDIRHLAFRKGHAGLVEIWPLFKSVRKEKPEPWQLPTDIEPGDDAAGKLAHEIAATIRGWLDRREILPAKGRPIRASDIMILVQTRSSLVDLLMRALKEQKVPVAGVDRLKLKKEIAVMDLLALAAFALQPRDDLTLAAILKSPLIGVSEEELFTLCHNRRMTLWATIQAQRPDIADYLLGFIERSGYATPYEFLAGALYRPCPADTVSGRRAFFGRLGFDIGDALDEFLNSSLLFEQTHTPSLQKFIDWFGRGEAEVKREQDAGEFDQVRIMTVHASKGLQAPIVFLPDTTKIIHDHNKGRVRLLWPSEQEIDTGIDVPLWSPRKEFDAQTYATWQADAAEKQFEEYRRLLYVALTRAEDRLYICGYQGKKDIKDGCWYQLIDQAFPKEAEKIAFAAETGDDMPGFIRRIEHAQTAAVAPHQPDETAELAKAVYQPLPAWATRPPEDEPMPPMPLAPSRPDEEEPAVQSPLADSDSWKFRRGLIVHQILELLPQVPLSARKEALDAYLARDILALPEKDRTRFAEEVISVLDHPDFAPIFGPQSRAEVPVVGLVGKAGKPRILSGQIDRLLVRDNDVLVIDYKTNRPPPLTEEGVAPVYLKQMAIYRAVLRDIYPGREIKCALLWTDALRLMPLSDKALDDFEP